MASAQRAHKHPGRVPGRARGPRWPWRGGGFGCKPHTQPARGVRFLVGAMLAMRAGPLSRPVSCARVSSEDGRGSRKLGKPSGPCRQ